MFAGIICREISRHGRALAKRLPPTQNMSARNSHHAGLVRFANLLASIFRRHAEVDDCDMDEAWSGEMELIDG